MDADELTEIVETCEFDDRISSYVATFPTMLCSATTSSA